MAYKLIALDIDDTLLNSQGKISSRTRRAINSAHSLGKRVVLSTGRALIGISTLYNNLNLSDVTICCGGAQVYSVDHELLYACPLDSSDAKAVIQFGEKHNYHYQVYFNDAFCFPRQNRFSDSYAEFYGIGGVVMPEIPTMKEVVTPKILFIDEPERILAIQPLARETFPKLKVVRSKSIFLEFNNPNATKGNALKFIADFYGYDPSEIIAVGDSQIDASMIEFAGLGVAVGNALDEIKAISDHVCPSNDEDGVAHVIEEFMLKK